MVDITPVWVLMVNNMKKRNILIVLILVLLVLIISLICFVYLNNRKIDNNPLYGVWESDSSEVLRDGLIILVNENIENHYLEFNKDKIGICYIIDNNTNCNYYNYTVNGNMLTIEDNDDYLTGEINFNIEDKILTIEKSLKKSNTLMRYHFIKKNKYYL